jgi:uncharacterized membrane protein
MYHWLLFLHLLGAFSFFAGATVAAVGQTIAMRRERPSEVALLLGATRWGVVLVGVGALFTIGFGSWLVADRPYWQFDQAWIEWAMVLWLASMVVGGLGGRPARHARELAERLAAEGDHPSEELRRAVRDRYSLVLSFLSGALLIAILVLMVWKPGT